MTTKMSQFELDAWAVDDARRVTFEMVAGAKTGHPGSAIGMAPSLQVLFHRHFNINPAQPKWMNRDKFVMSVGHAVNIQYVLMGLMGFDLTEEDLKGWRVLGSKCPGHPENYMTPGIECCTGPLGQGIGQAMGMAIAEKHLAANYNKPGFEVVDNYTYCVVGEGCIMEGMGAEVSGIAGALGLDKLIVLFDNNDIQLSGDTQANNFHEDVAMRYRSYNWQVIEVARSSTCEAMPALEKAILEAKADKERPSIIIMKSIIGEGLGEGIEGTISAHCWGGKYTPEACDAYRRQFRTYTAPADYTCTQRTVDHFAQARERVAEGFAAWEATMARYKEAYPAEHAELLRRFDTEHGPTSEARVEQVFDSLKELISDVSKPERSAVSYGRLFAWAKEHMPEFVGGSADVGISCKTNVPGEGAMVKGNFKPRNVEFGVREMAMVSAVNGMSAYGGFVPYCSAYMNFMTGYAQNGLRLAAMSQFNTMFIMTHDSIGVGADGGSHQPVECLASMRAMPNMRVWRPADSAECVAAFADCVAQKYKGPSTVSLCRQNLPQLFHDGLTSAELARNGGYIVRLISNPRMVVVATGSELHLAIKAVDLAGPELAKQIQIVSLPCAEVFREQMQEYRDYVFPPGVPVFSAEASATHGWVAPWGDYADHQGVDKFGESGSSEDLYNMFGFTPEKMAAKIRAAASKRQAEGKDPLRNVRRRTAPNLSA